MSTVIHDDRPESRKRRAMKLAVRSGGYKSVVKCKYRAIAPRSFGQARPVSRQPAQTDILRSIDALYSELAELVARSAEEPQPRGTIAEKRRRLIELQEQEADLAEKRARRRLHLQPGAGYLAIRRISELLRR